MLERQQLGRRGTKATLVTEVKLPFFWRVTLDYFVIPRGTPWHGLGRLRTKVNAWMLLAGCCLMASESDCQLAWEQSWVPRVCFDTSRRRWRLKMRFTPTTKIQTISVQSMRRGQLSDILVVSELGTRVQGRKISSPRTVKLNPTFMTKGGLAAGMLPQGEGHLCAGAGAGARCTSAHKLVFYLVPRRKHSIPIHAAARRLDLMSRIHGPYASVGQLP